MNNKKLEIMSIQVKLIKQTKIYISGIDDRLIYTELDAKGKIVGLNYMQEHTNMESFEKHHQKNDEELMDDYSLFLRFFEDFHRAEDEIEILNQFIWYRFNQEGIFRTRKKLKK